MSLEFEHTYTCRDLSLEEIVQRTQGFFLSEGCNLVGQDDGLYFQRGKGRDGTLISTQPKEYGTHIRVRFQPGQTGIRVSVHYKIVGFLNRASVVQFELMYWALEWWALQATLAGKRVPNWQDAYMACRQRYIQLFKPVRVLLSVVVFPTLVVLLYVTWRLYEWLDSVTWAIVWLATSFIIVVIFASAIENAIAFKLLRTDADQLWTEVQSQGQ